MPVLAGEGAFFVLDGAPKGNQIGLPQKLRVLAFSGKGEYCLLEDEKNSRSMTHFASDLGESGEQVVRFYRKDEGNILPVRSYVFEFRNIVRGKVVAMEGGAEKDVRVDHRSGYTRVHVDAVAAGAVCEIRVLETVDESECFRRRLTEKLAQLEWENGGKAELFDELCKCADGRKRREAARKSGLPERYVEFLCEGFAQKK